MKTRCYNPKHNRFHVYGGRGIKVCDEWLNDFEAFLDYIGEAPSPDHSIDRIDNDGDYEPGNVRWATYKAQSNNTSVVRRINYRGKSKTIEEWADTVGMSKSGLQKRLRKKKDLTEVFEKPLQKQYKITYEGACKSLKEWSQETGIKVDTLRARVKRGLSAEAVLETPLMKNQFG